MVPFVACSQVGFLTGFQDLQDLQDDARYIIAITSFLIKGNPKLTWRGEDYQDYQAKSAFFYFKKKSCKSCKS